jgi:hypothetical protein
METKLTELHKLIYTSDQSMLLTKPRPFWGIRKALDQCIGVSLCFFGLVCLMRFYILQKLVHSIEHEIFGDAIHLLLGRVMNTFADDSAYVKLRRLIATSKCPSHIVDVCCVCA